MKVRNEIPGDYFHPEEHKKSRKVPGRRANRRYQFHLLMVIIVALGIGSLGTMWAFQRSLLEQTKLLGGKEGADEPIAEDISKISANAGGHGEKTMEVNSKARTPVMDPGVDGHEKNGSSNFKKVIDGIKNEDVKHSGEISERHEEVEAARGIAKFQDRTKDEHFAKIDYVPRAGNAVMNKEVRVVNLAFRESKWNGMLDTLLGSTLMSRFTIKRSVGTFGKNVNLAEFYEKGYIGDKGYRSIISPRVVGGHYMTVGGLGCLLSHLDVWKACVELNKPIVVFEDDVALVPGFDDYFRKSLLDLPDDFGLFYFADMVNITETRRSNFDYDADSSMYKLIHGEHWGTFAYIISPHAAEVLVDHVYPINYQVDSYMIATCAEYNLSVYRNKVPLVQTENSGERTSDVQQKVGLLKNAVEIRFHLIDIPPMSLHLKSQLAKLKSEAKMHKFVKIEYFDKNRLEMEQIIDENSLPVDHPYYMLQVMIIKTWILYDHGGIFLQNDFHPKHSLTKFIRNVNGIISYRHNTDNTTEPSEKYQYPLIASTVHDKNMHKIKHCLIENLQRALKAGNTVDHIYHHYQTGHQCITDSTVRFPIHGSIVLFPATIITDTGY